MFFALVGVQALIAFYVTGLLAKAASDLYVGAAVSARDVYGYVGSRAWVVLLTGIIVLLFRESVTLTLIGLAPLVILVLLTYGLARRMHKLFYRVDQALGNAVRGRSLAPLDVAHIRGREPHALGQLPAAEAEFLALL